MIDDHWGRRFIPTSATLVEDNGVVTAGLTVSFGDPALISSTIYDLRDSRVSVEVARRTTDDAAKETFLALHAPDDVAIAEFRTRAGLLEAILATATVFAADYQPTHRFWRLRGEDETLYWETSADGSDYVVFAERSAAELGLDRVSIRLGIRGTGTGTGDQADFDNVNTTQ
jgi:hypothetical protein